MIQLTSFMHNTLNNQKKKEVRPTLYLCKTICTCMMSPINIRHCYSLLSTVVACGNDSEEEEEEEEKEEDDDDDNDNDCVNMEEIIDENVSTDNNVDEDVGKEDLCMRPIMFKMITNIKNIKNPVGIMRVIIAHVIATIQSILLCFLNKIGGGVWGIVDVVVVVIVILDAHTQKKI